MTVAVVTDSAASLPRELAEAHGVTVVPMWLVVDGESHRDGELSLDRLLAGSEVTTSGPTPGDFEAAIERRAEADGVLVLTIAASMSSTYRSAAIAAEPRAARVRVVDTATAAGAEGLVVLAAARAAASGADLATVEAVARDVLGRVHLVATVPDLDHLVRSGRVPGIAGWAGRQLRVNPLFEFRDGAAKRLRPAMGHDAALDRIVHAWHRTAPARPADLHVAALHALAPDDARTLLDRVRADTEPVESFVGDFGSVMVAHVGPGLVGLAWWWEPID